MPNTIADVLAALLTSERTFVADLDPDDPMCLLGLRIEDLVTNTVDFLRTPAMFDCPKVNDLMRLVWDIIGQKAVPIAIGPPVPRPTIAVLSIGAVIFMPPNWPGMMEQDPQMQIGSLIFIGSNARDYYRGKILSPKDSETTKGRAFAYEAEYLHALKALGSTKFNEYQQHIMAEFPDGVPDHLAYDSGEFFSSTPC